MPHFFPGTLILLGRVDHFIESHDKSIVAAFTVVLAISTIGLWLATVGLYRTGGKQIAAAVKAARVAELALTELEAPHVAVNIIDPGVSADTVINRYTRGRLKYRFVNHGRTPAQIISYAQRIRVAAPRTGSPPPLTEDFMIPVPYGFIIPPRARESELITMNCNTEIEYEHQMMLNDRKNRVFLMIMVRYADIFGAVYFTSLCYLLDEDAGRFVLTGDGAPRNEWRKEKSARDQAS